MNAKLQTIGAAVAFGVGLLMTSVTMPGAPSSSAKRGGELFEKRCAGCHALDSAKAGPPLRRSFARRAAIDASFPYSDALRKAQLTWDEAALDKWLRDPDSLVPGNDMSFRLDNSEERSAIISYLKELAGK